MQKLKASINLAVTTLNPKHAKINHMRAKIYLRPHGDRVGHQLNWEQHGKLMYDLPLNPKPTRINTRSAHKLIVNGNIEGDN